MDTAKVCHCRRKVMIRNFLTTFYRKPSKLGGSRSSRFKQGPPSTGGRLNDMGKNFKVFPVPPPVPTPTPDIDVSGN